MACNISSSYPGTGLGRMLILVLKEESGNNSKNLCYSFKKITF
jgi:hypothetical protein